MSSVIFDRRDQDLLREVYKRKDISDKSGGKPKKPKTKNGIKIQNLDADRIKIQELAKYLAN